MLRRLGVAIIRRRAGYHSSDLGSNFRTTTIQFFPKPGPKYFSTTSNLPTDDDTYNDRILCFAQKGEHGKALLLYREMKAKSLRVSMETSKVVFNCFQDEHWKDSFLLLKDMQMQELDIDPHFYHSVIKLFANNNDWLQPFLIFREMMDKGTLPLPETIGVLCAVGERRDNFDMLSYIFHQSQVHNLIPNDLQVYRDIICTAARNGNLEFILEVLNKLLTINVALEENFCSASVYACKLRGHPKAGEVLEALGLTVDAHLLVDLAKIFSRQGYEKEMDYIVNRLLPKTKDTNCYNAVIWAFEREGKWEEAMGVLRSMAMKGVRPNEETCDAVIALRDQGDMWKEAKELIQTMKLSGHRHMYHEAKRRWDRTRSTSSIPSAVEYEKKMAAYLRHRYQPSKFIRLLEQMVEENIPIRATAFNNALCGLALQVGWKGLMEDLFGKMESFGVSPNAETYNIALAKLFDEGLCAEVLVLLDAMQERGVAPSTATYEVAMRSCVCDRRWDHVLSFYEELHVKGVSKSFHVFEAALQACAVTKQWDRAIRILSDVVVALDNMELHELSHARLADLYRSAFKSCDPSISEQLSHALELFRDLKAVDSYVYNESVEVMMTLCNGGQKWDATVAMYASMMSERLSVSVEVANLALEACGHEGASEVALNALGTLNASLSGAQEKSYELAFSACCKALRWQEALLLLCDMKNKRMQISTHSLDLLDVTIAACGDDWKQAVRLAHANIHVPIAGRFAKKSWDDTINQCTRDGQWENALALLSKMKESEKPSIQTFNLIISTLERFEKWDEILALCVELKRAGLRPTALTYAAVIGALEKQERWEESLQLMHEVDASGVGPIDKMYHSVLFAAVRGGQHGQAIRTLREMKEWGMSVCRVACNAVASACERDGDWRNVLLLSLEMDQAPESADAKSLNAAIWERCEAGYWQEALSIFRAMQADGMSPSVVTYNLIISTLEAIGQTALALSTFQDMRRAGVVPNGSTCVSVMRALAEEQQWEDALSLLREMPQSGIAPIESHFEAVVGACARAQRVDEALSVLQEMKDAGFKPSVSTFNNILMSLERSGQWQKVLNMAEEMKAAGLTPDSDTYCAILSACGMGGKLETILALLREMQTKDVAPNFALAHAAICACEVTGDARAVEREMGGALRQLRGSMSPPNAIRSLAELFRIYGGAGKAELVEDIMACTGEQGIRVDNNCCNAAIWAFEREGKWEEAVGVLRSMEMKGVVPNEETYEAVIAVCERGKAWKEAKDLLTEMTSKGVSNEAARSAVVRACALNGASAVALEILREAKESGLPISSSTYNTTVRGCLDDGCWSQAVELVKEMKYGGVYMSRNTLAEILSGCGHKGDWGDVLLLMRDFVPEGSLVLQTGANYRQGGNDARMVADFC